MQLLKSKWIVLIGSLVVAITAGTTVVIAVGNAGSEPPSGVSTGVSSLDRLPAVSNLPPKVQAWLTYDSTLSGTDPTQARASVRRLRSTLGTTQSDVYAFRSRSGATCYLITGRTGSCPQDASRGTPGFQWTIGGGYPGVPSALAGVVADDVSAIELTVDGKDVPVSIENNFAFAEFPTTAQRADVSVRHVSGAVSSFNVNLQG
ncbi:MAG: hypothetical protein WCE47_14000 [Gaiella sp.]|jgi:hypothetical protein|uniref:hypothetical protein n=1 Tax=Gaiella sp. TaxID=2663207 RepID=UPI002D016F7A|nr:hypothetical protein [Gaiella sp.]